MGCALPLLLPYKPMTPTPFTELPPISDPVFTVNGRQLVVIWGVMAQFKLSEWGVDAVEAWSVIQPGNGNSRGLFFAFSMFAAMVAHNYKPGERAPSAQDWVMIFGEDAKLRDEMYVAIGQALGKRLQVSMRKKTEATPAIQIPVPSTSGVQ